MLFCQHFVTFITFLNPHENQQLNWFPNSNKIGIYNQLIYDYNFLFLIFNHTCQIQQPNSLQKREVELIFQLSSPQSFEWCIVHRRMLLAKNLKIFFISVFKRIFFPGKKKSHTHFFIRIYPPFSCLLSFVKKPPYTNKLLRQLLVKVWVNIKSLESDFVGSLLYFPEKCIRKTPKSLSFFVNIEK